MYQYHYGEWMTDISGLHAEKKPQYNLEPKIK